MIMLKINKYVTLIQDIRMTQKAATKEEKDGEKTIKINCHEEMPPKYKFLKPMYKSYRFPESKI